LWGGFKNIRGDITMSELALQLIAENKKARAPFLARIIHKKGRTSFNSLI